MTNIDYATALSCAEELQEILDFDVHNALESDATVTSNTRDVFVVGGPGVDSFWICKREARVLAARLLRAASQ